MGCLDVFVIRVIPKFMHRLGAINAEKDNVTFPFKKLGGEFHKIWVVDRDSGGNTHRRVLEFLFFFLVDDVPIVKRGHC